MMVDPHDDLGAITPHGVLDDLSPVRRRRRFALTPLGPPVPTVLGAVELVAAILLAWVALAAAIVLAGLLAAVAVELFSIGWGWVR